MGRRGNVGRQRGTGSAVELGARGTLSHRRWWRGTLLLAAATLSTFIGCAGTQTIRFTTSEPAEIWVDSRRVCVTTPCSYSYERGGCGFPRLAASNQFAVTARTADGRSVVVGATDHCDVDDEWYLVLPPPR